MDLPVWQALYSELQDKNFVVITVALDTAGEAAAGQWIRAANPTYPCLIDAEHRVADLYGMVNVPQAVWIDEAGLIVRPTETAGTTDGFRRMDQTTFTIPADDLANLRETRRTYRGALRDWAERGAASPYVLNAEERTKRLKPISEGQQLARAHFRLGEHLHGIGKAADAQLEFAEAKRLHPDSWEFARQAWALEDPVKSGGPEFWAAVAALGDKHYYEPVRLTTDA